MNGTKKAHTTGEWHVGMDKESTSILARLETASLILMILGTGVFVAQKLAYIPFEALVAAALTVSACAGFIAAATIAREHR